MCAESILENRKTMNKSKFLCYKCENLIFVNNLEEHLTFCKFNGEIKIQNTDTNENDYGECEFCHEIVYSPKTKHLQVTQFQPSECELYYSICPNCDLKDVLIKHHFKNCRRKPKICDFQQFGCYGYVLVNTSECTERDLHRELIETSFRNFCEKLKRTKSIAERENQYLEIREIQNNIIHLKNAVTNIKMIYKTSRYGKFVWKIYNVISFLNETIPNLSIPIYTSERGYKLCLKVYPNGEGIGKGSHFSIFFMIMKGNYDDLLHWPFTLKTKITLYNKNMHSLTKSEIYKPNQNLSGFKKPTSNFNLAVGNPKFIELKDLSTKGFIENNSISIGVCVHK